MHIFMYNIKANIIVLSAIYTLMYDFFRFLSSPRIEIEYLLKSS